MNLRLRFSLSQSGFGDRFLSEWKACEMSWGKRARLIANQALWALWHRFPFIRSLCLNGNWFILMESRGPSKCFYPTPLLSAHIDWIWMWLNWTPQWCWQATKCFETYVSALHHKSWNHLGNWYNSTPSRKEIRYKILWVFGGSRRITANPRARWLWTARLLSCRCQGPVWYAGEGLLQDACSHTHSV